MSSTVETVLGKRDRILISRSSEEAAKLMKDIVDYYATFEKKIRTFNLLKEGLIELSAKLAVAEKTNYRMMTPEEIEHLSKKATGLLKEMKQELRVMRESLSLEEKIKRGETTYDHHLLRFITYELGREAEHAGKPYWPRLKEVLENLKKLLTASLNESTGLFNVLASQAQLLRDIERAEKEAESRTRRGVDAKRNNLLELVRIIETEILRFGEYVQLESQILAIGTMRTTTLKADFNALRNLGLVYSEPRITPFNIGLLTISLRANQKGSKGIGIIHDDDTVEFRFVKGKNEKHSEVVQMLLKGVPGMRLAGDLAIAQYLRSLPLSTITRIAGYEIQFSTDKQGRIRLVNIDYNSTILQVQIERKTNQLSGEYLRITKQDFERLNYGLLFSIDQTLLDKKKFEMTIRQTGSKIVVSDKRIEPFT